MQRLELGPGERFGDFTVEELAGRGGMGVVYRATQNSLQRPVALKVISPHIADAADFRERFAQESRLAAGIDDPHVVSIYDAGELDEQSYIAMQWVDGRDLRAVLDEHRDGLDVAHALSICAQIAQALEAAHRQGLVHRDVKPGNILVRYIGGRPHAYLTDFGVAKALDAAQPELTRTGYRIGTSGFMAPEQIRGDEPDGRADLYALGCVLFESLTGQRPFPAANENAESWAHANDPRPTPSQLRPGLDERYDEVVARAMAIDPDERFGSGAEFARSLEAIAAGQPLPRPLDDLTAATAAMAGGEPAPAGYRPTQIERATPLRPSAGMGPASTPAPPPERRRKGHRAALVLAGAVAAAGIAVGAIAATGGFGGKDAVTTPTAAAATKHATKKPEPAPTPKKAPSKPTPKAQTTPTAPSQSTPTTSTPAPAPVAAPQFTEHSAFGYQAQIPTGSGWSEASDSQPTPGKLFRTSVRGPNGQFLIIDYTPEEKPAFGGRFISKRQVGQTAFGSATQYIFQGGTLPECQRAKCVDYLVADPASSGGFGVLAGGPDFAVAQTIAQTTVESLTPPSDYGD